MTRGICDKRPASVTKVSKSTRIYNYQGFEYDGRSLRRGSNDLLRYKYRVAMAFPACKRCLGRNEGV